MRLRLKISRNELPTTKILYNLPSETLTVSAFLDRINELVPLEADGWGLDDYVAEVNGYECLHYQALRDILHVDDEVSIRPLRSSDIKARRLSGRYQINAAGAHLIDGIAFGSQYLKRPNRPPIAIPPRKRRRVSYGIDEHTLQSSPLETGSQPLRNGSSSRDANLQDIAKGHPNLQIARQRKQDDKLDNSSRVRPRRSVSFAENNVEDEDEEEADDDYTPKSSGDDASFSEESDSETGTVEILGMNEHDDDTLLHRRRSRVSESDSNSNSNSDSGSSTSSSDISSFISSSDVMDEDNKLDQPREDTSTLSNPSTEKQLVNTKAKDRPKKGNGTHGQNFEATSKDQSKTRAQVPPGQGKRATQKRNERRRRKGRLIALSSQGLLPENGVELDLESPQNPDSITQLQAESEETWLRDAKMTDQDSALSEELTHGTTTSLSTSQIDDPRRRRIDINSTRRMIFNSLGTRVPKTKAESDKVRAKLSNNSSHLATYDNWKNAKMAQSMNASEMLPANVHAEASPGEITAGDNDVVSDEWKNKIRLMTVECAEEGVTLVAPPFPFVQRWDPQQQFEQHSSRSGSKRKKRKRDNDTSQQYNMFEDVLNYDDEFAGEEEVIKDSQEDDLPLLPKNISLLPNLTRSDVKPSAVVAFKYLEMSANTNWQPLISTQHRTALVETFDEGSDLLQLTLAQRDRANDAIRYDEDGNRIYHKFEMPEDDENAEDEGKIDIEFGDMVDAKLVAACESTDNNNVESGSYQSLEHMSEIIVPNSIGVDYFVSAESSPSQSFIGPIAPGTISTEEDSPAVLHDSNGAELPAAQKQDPSISDSASTRAERTRPIEETQHRLSKSSSSGMETENVGMIEASA